jgi:CHAD domain-containing protein
MARPAPIEGLAPDTPAGEAAVRIILARLGDVRRFELALAREATPDGVHDLRVATRRLRAALRLFDRKRQLRAAHDEVKALGDVLGAVRELHVQLAWLARAARAGDERERPGIDALARSRSELLPGRLAAMHTAIAKWQAAAPSVDEAIAGLTLRGRLGGHTVRKRLRRRLRSVRKRRDAALARDDARTAHALRIGVKKLRYDAELAQAAFPDELAALLDRLEPLQELLGDLHDADVHLPVLEQFLARAVEREQPGALALLRAELGRRQELARRLGDELHRFRDERVLEQLRDELC